MEKQNILKDPSIDGVKVKSALYSQSYDILLLNSGTAGHLFIRKLSKLLSLCAAGVMKVKNAEYFFAGYKPYCLHADVLVRLLDKHATSYASHSNRNSFIYRHF